MEDTAMARKSAGRKKPMKATLDRPGIAVTLRGSPEWKEWLEGLAFHCRLDVAKVIDRALIDYAKKEGYGREAPRR
jgi:hypothetical protein